MWCYENDKNNKIRYILGEKGDHPLFCIGINPSTAEPNSLDPTVHRVKQMSIRNNFDGWFMLNVYPQRSTNPDKIQKSCNDEIHNKNIFFINNYLKKYDKPIIWAAWGTLIEKRKYMIECLKDIYEKNKNCNTCWINFGSLTKKGHPRHPLYLSYSSEKNYFDIKNYIKKNQI